MQDTLCNRIAWSCLFPQRYCQYHVSKQCTHIAVSLDGHTATLDNELDWLPGEIKAIVGKHCLEADCLLMGANTYTYIFEHWGGWPYKSQRSFVVSHDRRTAAQGL